MIREFTHDIDILYIVRYSPRSKELGATHFPSFFASDDSSTLRRIEKISDRKITMLPLSTQGSDSKQRLALTAEVVPNCESASEAIRVSSLMLSRVTCPILAILL